MSNLTTTHKPTPFEGFMKKLKRTAGKFKIIPAHAYRPETKAMSRRDRIRAGLQKRNERNADV
jgi:hypothetical protein